MGQFTDSRYKGGMALKSNLPITAASQMLYWGGKGQEGEKKKDWAQRLCGDYIITVQHNNAVTVRVCESMT